MCDHCGCREFEAIAELTADHEVILDLAWKLSESVRNGVPIDPVGHERLMYLMDMHVLKEEKGLYPLLMGTGDLSADECALLEEEHTDLGAALVAGEFERRAYFALAAHIEQEESELFSAAMFAFDDEQWDQMLDVHRAADPAHAAAGVK